MSLKHTPKKAGTGTITNHNHPMMSSRAGIQNEDWDDDLSLHQHQKVGAAVAVLSPSRVDSSLLHNAAEPEETIAASSLDDYLQKYPSVFDFVLSIPSRDECKHKLLPSDNERKNEEEPCDESVSVVSDITEMTYRAELMKQVSSEDVMHLLS